MARTVELQHLRRAFWRGVREGLSTVDAARRAGVSADRGFRWFRECGGVSPVDLAEPKGRYLSLSEREEISRGLAAELSFHAIARQLGRVTSTISREIDRNTADGRAYRAVSAQLEAEKRARRPKPRKLEHPALHERVTADLEKRWSPEAIAARLRQDFPDDEAMQASHETIYQALFVQGRGALRRDLTSRLRTGRALRRPRRRVDGRADPDRRIPDKVMISDRPAEADDRAVPGHWEGDFVMGKNNRSAVATLV
jgi:IS30 family transposase